MSTTLTFKDKLPQNVFECFRMSLSFNTANENPTDEEVEKYIHALLDTSDSQHPQERKLSKPTFKPAA